MTKYETYSKVKEIYNVSPETVRNWARRGQIKYKCVQNATRKTWLFDIESIGQFLQQNTDEVKVEEENRGNKASRIIYIRVSSAKQAPDLERQRELLSTAFPNTEVLSDIGSGINFHRPGFTSLVRRICRDQISQVIISYKDRLCRFGYELFELICKEHGCTILVYGEGINNTGKDNELPDEESELKDDLLAIVNVFVASHNGKRGAALRKERNRLKTINTTENTETKTATKRCVESKDLPDNIPEDEIKIDDVG